MKTYFVTKPINMKNNCSHNKGKVTVNLLIALQQSFLAYPYHLTQYDIKLSLVEPVQWLLHYGAPFVKKVLNKNKRVFGAI